MNSLNVVNDSTERCVKLSADFLDTAKTEENYQNILQVVEDHSKTETTSANNYNSRN